MSLVRRLSCVALAVTAGSALIAAHPLCGPEFGEWQPPVLLGPEINSAPSYGAAISRDGTSLYLTRGAGAAANLFVSRRASREDPWGPPENLGSVVNTESYCEMIPFLSRDEHFLFFTSDRPGSQGWDLWVSWRWHTWDDFGWQAPVNLGPGVNSADQETSGSLLMTWRRKPLLFFASNRLLPGQPPPAPGQLPVGTDIYVSEWQPDGTFGEAARDEELSTFAEGLEDFEGRPMVRFDGREIIFVSDRPGGQGGNDLWVATRDSVDQPWGTPINIQGLNSDALELHPYLSPDGATLYFTRRKGNLPYLYMTTRSRKVRGGPR